MKKLMVAALVAVAAACANAASIKWSCTGVGNTGTIYNGTAEKLTTVAGVYTAYLFDTATLSQADVLTALRSGSDIASLTSIGTAGVNASSKIAATMTTYGESNVAYNFYMAIVNDDKVYLSQIVNATALAVGDTTVSFAARTNTASKNNFGMGDYSAAGWYQTVPEPTSGLLLLLGMAGLALKRKQV